MNLAGTIDPAHALGGLVGGFAAGLTGVGVGAVLTPMLEQILGVPASGAFVPDLVRAISLAVTAALGHVLHGGMSLGLLTSLLIGALPGAYLGARLSSSQTSSIVRAALTVLLVASGTRVLTS